jgi:hypothetical protein
VVIGCCAKFAACVADSSQAVRVPGATLGVCEGCHLFAPIIGVDYLVCPFRGAATGAELVGSCGCDRKIYHCDKKGKCLKRLPVGKSVSAFGAYLDGVTICKSCNVPASVETGLDRIPKVS